MKKRTKPIPRAPENHPVYQDESARVRINPPKHTKDIDVKTNKRSS